MSLDCKPSRLRTLAAGAVSLALCACSEPASPGTPSDESWPEITQLPIRVAPISGTLAGDVVLSHDLPIPNRPFLEMGALVSAPGGIKRLPNFEFYVQAGVEVVSPVNGVVIDVVAHQHVADYAVLIGRAADSRGVWVEVDHVTNPRVAKGAAVTAGQVIGNAGISPRDGIGRVELQISKSDGNTVRYFCPNLAFAPSARGQIESSLSALMAAVESWSGIASTYDEAAMVRPGCNLEMFIEGVD